jgi:hypothetical protein
MASSLPRAEGFSWRVDTAEALSAGENLDAIAATTAGDSLAPLKKERFSVVSHEDTVPLLEGAMNGLGQNGTRIGREQSCTNRYTCLASGIRSIFRLEIRSPTSPST